MMEMIITAIAVMLLMKLMTDDYLYQRLWSDDDKSCTGEYAKLGSE